jgi:flagellar motility protein MotE (MotC chaperone)
MPEPEPGSPVPAGGPSSSQAKPKSNLIPIAAGVIVFVAFVIVFSLKFGVFSSANVAPPSAQQIVDTKSDSLARVDSIAKADSITFESEGYDNLFPDFEELQSPDDNQQATTGNDSIAKAKWYEDQKTQIAQQMSQLEQEKVQLETLKGEVEALLQRKKSTEEGNIVQMAKLYEGMATEELVPILANLSDAQVSVMISKMKKQKASEVLGKLPPERAAKVTQYIISMNGDGK